MSTGRSARLWALLLTLGLLAVGSAADDEPNDPGDDESDDTGGKVKLVLDVGGHTGRVNELAFSADSNRLYTSGSPGEVSEWDVKTGDRLRVWRFPNFANHLAVSGDGKRLVVITVLKEHKDAWAIDLATGEARLVPLKGHARKPVNKIALSHDGKRLALNCGKETQVYDLETRSRVGPVLHTDHTWSLAYHPSKQRLLTSSQHAPGGKVVQTFNATVKSKGNATEVPGAARNDPVAIWSPDGERVLAMSGGQATLRLLSPDKKKPVWEADREKLGKLTGAKERGDCISVGLGFLSDKVVVGCWNFNGRLRVVRANMEKKGPVHQPDTDIRLQSERTGRVAFSPDGRWMAVTTNPSYRVVLYDFHAARQARVLGPSVRAPRSVAWTGNGYGVAWGYGSSVQDGLSLDQLELLKKDDLKALAPAQWQRGWKLHQENDRRTYLTRPGAGKVLIDLYDTEVTPALVYKTEGGKHRLLVVHAGKRKLSIVNPDTGKEVKRVPGRFNTIYDMALSPDGKYLAVAGGEAALRVYSMAKMDLPVLNIMPHGSNWMVWSTQSGYYAATPGGQRLVGWKFSTAEDQVAAFYPAERFRKRLYRPDVIQQVLPAGSVTAALKQCKVEERPLDELQPPRVSITVKPDPTDKEKMIVTAEAASKGQPIKALRLLLDGRPVQLKEFGDGAGTAKATWPVVVPVGQHELKVLARCAEVAGISDAHPINVPVKAKDRPALHVLAVGMNKMGNPALDLKCPKNDAEKIKEQFKASCIGNANLFSDVRSTSKPLVDEQATRKAVLDELKRIRKEVRPGDLVVFFYAGHGVREGGKFYLLTHGSDLAKLDKTALSGDDLYNAMKEYPCQVLVLLDACHSGDGAKALTRFKSATDDAARDLADDECAVTVLAAAMGHERALEPLNGEHGLFTDALLGALKRNAGVPYNVRDGRQYVHHLFSHVFDDVQTASKDRQHPFLSLPWTSESFPVRQVAKGEGTK